MFDPDFLELQSPECVNLVVSLVVRIMKKLRDSEVLCYNWAQLFHNSGFAIIVITGVGCEHPQLCVHPGKLNIRGKLVKKNVGAH